MKAISLWQPWATLIALGAKRVETRSWALRFDEPFLIHAALKWTPQLDLACHREFREALRPLWENRAAESFKNILPRGCLIAVCNSAKPARVVGHPRESKALLDDGSIIEPTEWPYGDYAVGRYASRLGAVWPIEPIPFTGKQGPFVVPDDVAKSVVYL